MLNLLASILLFLLALISYGRSGMGVNAGSFSQTQSPSPSFFPTPTEAPTIAPSTGSTFPPAQAPAVVLPPPTPLSSPPPPRPPPPPPLPPPPLVEDVKAVNDLLDLSWTPGVLNRPRFHSEDCKTYKFYPQIWCDCSSGSCRVTTIQLRNQNLRGMIPKNIGNQLTELTSLDLTSNQLRGSLPESIASLSKLSVLSLGQNNFEGHVPNFLAKIPSLTKLYLTDNSFSGPIPREFGTFPSLQFLYLGNNLLNESIPPELGSISQLILLDLRDNFLSGQLPEQLGGLKSLSDLDLSNNNLIGSLPSTFQNLLNLNNFNIRGNNFNGTIPAESISKWQQLWKLDLSGNSFSGPPLPAAITALTALTYLSVTDSAHEQGTDFSIPDVKSDVTWRTLILRNCSLTGQIPDFIWMLPSLTYLDLSFNNLFGSIPANVKLRIGYLDSIFLRSNKLNGTLPEWLTKLIDSNVDVSENFFTKVAIPTGIVSQNLNLFSCCNTTDQTVESWQQSNYYCAPESKTYENLYINCGGNKTRLNDGKDYAADMQPYGASTFYLSDNKAWAYSSMGKFLDRNQKNYTLNETCNITMADAPLYKDARISSISLKYYGFCLKKGDYKLKLHFAEIGWQANKASPQSRRVFDIAIQDGHRQQYVKDFNIEKEAGGVDIDITREFNVTVSGGRLEVHLYWSGKGSTPTRYYGPLISAISLSPPASNEPWRPSPGTVGAIVGSTTVFVALLLAIFWKLGWLDKKNSKEFGPFELFPGELLNFQKTKAATGNFDPKNLLTEGAGFGDVYKGVLPNGTEIIAVKRISATSNQGRQKFMNEIATIFALQHPNLVSLKGCCAKDNELLLVHEYMENGHLENALFGSSDKKSSLNWIRRLRICLDVAKGLEFLHDKKESKRQMIHGDINPKIILLDKDFNAKISDFGYADFNEDEYTRKSGSPKGTSVYMAPERVQGLVSPKGDVYSFGMVMLEFVSGIRASSTGKSKNQSDVYLLDIAYEHQKDNNLPGLLDSSLGKDYSYKEAIKVLNLAMVCLTPGSTLRPTMSEVVQALEGVLKVEETKKNLKDKSPGNTTSSGEAQSRTESTSQGDAISSSSSKEIDD